MLQRCWIGAALALAAVAAPAHGQVQLEWKFKEGSKFYLETVSSSRQGMKFQGKELRQDTELTFLFSVAVQQVKPDKSAVLVQKLEGLFVRNLGGPAGQINAEDKFNQQLVGTAFHLTVTPRGEVTDFEGYEQLLKKLAGEDAVARKTVQAVLSKEYLKRAATEVFAVLPPKPVKGGDSWGADQKQDVPLGPLGSFTTTRKYTYEGKDEKQNKLDKITFTGTATYNLPRDKDTGPFPFQVTKADLKMEDIKGTIFFDEAAGRLVGMETRARVKGTMTVVANGNPIETELEQERAVKTRLLLEKPTQQ
jgi:hypothetical protein